jgi:hypothetical protein
MAEIENSPRHPGATRRGLARRLPKRGMTSRLLPADQEQEAACDAALRALGSPLPSRLPATPVRRGRRHPGVTYAMLNRLLAEAQKTAAYIDQLALAMERENLPGISEVRVAQEEASTAIAALMQVLNAGGR